MDFRQLRTFSCVAELGSLSKASDTLRVAQPALSQADQAAGTRAARRTVYPQWPRHGADRGRPSAAGAHLRHRPANRPNPRRYPVLRRPPSGRVVLGLVPTVSCVLSARLRAAHASKTIPGISLLHRRELQRPSDRMAASRRDGSRHHLRPLGRSASHVQSLGRDNIVAVGPRGCGLARKKKQVDIDWLLRQRLVLPSHSHGLRALIEHAARNEDRSSTSRSRRIPFRVLTSLVEEGLGYRVAAASSLRAEVADGRLEVATHFETGADARTHHSPPRSSIPVRPPSRSSLICSARRSRPAAPGLQRRRSPSRRYCAREVAACRKEGLWDIKLS